MTRKQLFEKYSSWAKKCNWYPLEEDLDNAVSVLVYESGQTEATHSGTQVKIIARYIKGKVRFFLFKEKTSWRSVYTSVGVEDGEELDSEYSLIMAY